jgi:hypothetical protein
MAAAATDFSLAADASGDGLAAWTEPSATCGHLVAVAAYSDAPSTMDPTPPGCAVPPPDTTPPAISLTGPKRQRPLQRHHVVLSLRCDENCQMKVSASVKMRGARRPLSLKPVSRKLKGGRRAALVLALSARVTKALAGLLAGQRASLVVTASARDAAGNSAAAKRTIALTR